MSVQIPQIPRKMLGNTELQQLVQQLNRDGKLQVHEVDQTSLPTPRHSFVALSLPRSAQCPCYINFLNKIVPHDIADFTHTSAPIGVQRAMPPAVTQRPGAHCAKRETQRERGRERERERARERRESKREREREGKKKRDGCSQLWCKTSRDTLIKRDVPPAVTQTQEHTAQRRDKKERERERARERQRKRKKKTKRCS